MKIEDRDILFLDTETTGLEETDDQLHGVAWALNDEPVTYSPAWNLPSRLCDLLADKNVLKVLFNGRFDYRFMLRAKIRIAGEFYDVMHLAQQVDENQPLGLKPLSEKYLGPQSLMNKAALDAAMHAAGVKNLGAFNKIDLLDPNHPHFPIIAQYGVEDVVNTRALFWIFVDRLKKIHKSLTEILKVTETPLTNYLKDIAPTERVLLKMEMQGIRADVPKIERIRDETLAKRDECLEKLNLHCAYKIPLVEEDLIDKAIADHIKRLKSDKRKEEVKNEREQHRVKFNWESAAHVGRLFFEKYPGLPPSAVKKMKSGQYALDETHLKNIPLPKNHPLNEVFPIYAAYKKTLKILGTYTGTDKKGIVARIRRDADGIPKIYALFPQNTNTGRLNPKRPNMANLPRTSPVKGFFIPTLPTSKFLYTDFSQLQLRIAAHVSRDPVMMEAYIDDLDLHKRTASKMFGIDESEVLDGQRQSGKTANFAAIFGASEYRLLSEFREKNGLDYTIEDCKRFRDAIFADWRGYAAYLAKELDFVKRNKFVISETGRVRRLPDIVYGDFLNYRRKEFTGPRELREKLSLAIKEGNIPDHLRRYPDHEMPFRLASSWYKHAVNQAYCTPIQGLESSIMKRCMQELHRRGYNLRNQIHDAIIAEVPITDIERAKAEIQHVLMNTYKLRVPLKAEVKIINSFDEKDKWTSSDDSVKKI